MYSSKLYVILYYLCAVVNVGQKQTFVVYGWHCVYFTGAFEEGVEGFFKGIGKGLMGLIVKPTGGAVDMVSMAADGVKR